jgi:hypothetical protein
MVQPDKGLWIHSAPGRAPRWPAPRLARLSRKRQTKCCSRRQRQCQSQRGRHQCHDRSAKLFPRPLQLDLGKRRQLNRIDRDAYELNRRADTALARRGDSSSRRRSRKPSRGMDSAGKIPQGRAPWPSIALAWRSHSLKRPAGSSRTMHRHRHRCWSRTFRPTRVREERSFALVASLGKRSSSLPHQYIPSGIGCLNHQSLGAKEDATAATGSPDATRDPR